MCLLPLLVLRLLLRLLLLLQLLDGGARAQNVTAMRQNFQPGACTATGLVFDGTDDYLALDPPAAIDEVGEVTLAMRIRYNSSPWREDSVVEVHERAFDFSAGRCGLSVFSAEVYASHRMRLNIGGCGELGVDNYWLIGDGQFHTYVFMVAAAGTSAYRDGAFMGSTGDCRGVPDADRTAMYIGGSTCYPGIHTSDMEISWLGLWNRESHRHYPHLSYSGIC